MSEEEGIKVEVKGSKNKPVIELGKDSKIKPGTKGIFIPEIGIKESDYIIDLLDSSTIKQQIKLLDGKFEAWWKGGAKGNNILDSNGFELVDKTVDRFEEPKRLAWLWFEANGLQDHIPLSCTVEDILKAIVRKEMLDRLGKDFKEGAKDTERIFSEYKKHKIKLKEWVEEIGVDCRLYIGV